MSLVLGSGSNNGGSTFQQHPVGFCLGVLVDVFALTEVNRYFGKTSPSSGRVDNFPTVLKLHFVFSTDVLMEDGRPFIITKDYNYSSNPKSNLVKDVMSWLPALAKVDIATFDWERLLGQMATLNILQNEYRTRPGEFYSYISQILSPKLMVDAGHQCPGVSADFHRANVAERQAREDAKIAQAQAAANPAMQPGRMAPFVQRPQVQQQAVPVQSFAPTVLPAPPIAPAPVAPAPAALVQAAPAQTIPAPAAASPFGVPAANAAPVVPEVVADLAQQFGATPQYQGLQPDKSGAPVDDLPF